MSFKTSEDELRSAFAQYGSVTDVYVAMDKMTGRPRGFAFITMGTAEEAKLATEKLNGADLGGRALTVNEARPKEDRPAGGGYGGGGGGVIVAAAVAVVAAAAIAASAVTEPSFPHFGISRDGAPLGLRPFFISKFSSQETRKPPVFRLARPGRFPFLVSWLLNYALISLSCLSKPSIFPPTSCAVCRRPVTPIQPPSNCARFPSCWVAATSSPPPRRARARPPPSRCPSSPASAPHGRARVPRPRAHARARRPGGDRLSRFRAFYRPSHRRHFRRRRLRSPAQELRRGVDIIVATPGRLMDFLKERTINLAGSPSSCSTKWTACSTWASCRSSRTSSAAARASGRRFFSPPPCPPRLPQSPPSRCATPTRIEIGVARSLAAP